MQSEHNHSSDSTTPTDTSTEIVGMIDNILSSRLRLPVMAALTMIMVTCFIGDTNLFQWERICLVGLFIWYLYNVCNYGFIVFMAWKFGTKNRYRRFSWILCRQVYLIWTFGWVSRYAISILLVPLCRHCICN